MAVITSNINLEDIGYSQGEIIDIRNGAIVTMTQTPSVMPGSITCTTSGKFLIENSSTSDPIVLTLLDQTRFMRFRANGIFETRGNMIEIGTGDGTEQTWDFSSLFGGLLTEITYVEVEQTPFSNDYIPWHIVEIDPRYYIATASNRGSVKSDFDDMQPVFFYHEGNRTLSCGDGVNGMAVPADCRIRIPNIFVTNQDRHMSSTRSHRIICEGAPTGGNFTITVRNERTNTVLGTTANINHNATPTQVRDALIAVTGASTWTSSGANLPAGVPILTTAGSLNNIPVTLLFTPNFSGGTSPVIYGLENAASNMSLVDLNPSGTADFECVMFSRKIRQTHTAFSFIRMIRVGTGADRLSIASTNGGVEIDHVNFSQNTYTIQAASQIFGIFGDATIKKWVNTSGLTETAAQVQNIPNLTDCEDVRHLAYGDRLSTSASCFRFVLLPSGLSIVRPRSVGGRQRYESSTGLTVIDPQSADHPSGAQLTTNVMVGFLFTNCSNIVVINPTNAGRSACRNQIISIDSASANISVFGGFYDGGGNSIGGVLNNGVNFTVRNFNVINLRSSSAFFHDMPSSYSGVGSQVLKSLATAEGDAPFGFKSCERGRFDLAAVSLDGFTETNASVENWVGGNFIDPGVDPVPTTGHITFGAFGRGGTLELTGAAFTDQLGRIFFPNQGDTAIVTMPYEIHGITSFQSIEPTLVGEGEDGFSNRWRITNDGGATGGSYTLDIFDASNTLIGTTAAIGHSASTTTVSTSLNAVAGTGAFSVSGSLSAGYIATRTNGSLVRIRPNTVDLTGGSKPGILNCLSRHNQNLAITINKTPGTQFANLTIECALKLPQDIAWTSWMPLSAANLQYQVDSLVGYDPNDGFNIRLRYTAIDNDDEYRIIQQTSMKTNVDFDSWLLPDASIAFAGAGPTDVVRITEFGTNTILYSFTGSGVKEFLIGANFGKEVYIQRENSEGMVLMRTIPNTFTLSLGFNGLKYLFYGDEVQLAQSAEVLEIKEKVDLFLDVPISTRNSQVTGDEIKAMTNLIPGAL